MMRLFDKIGMTMRFEQVYIDTIAYELPDRRLTTRDLEAELKPLYDRLRIPLGQLELMTGIRERRWWPDPFKVSDGAIQAATKALESRKLSGADLDMLIYAGVCRDHHEPATACRVAHELGLPRQALIYDISNACLGILNGILEIANRIELGQINYGMVVSCETAGPINQETIAKLLTSCDLEQFKLSLATLTGGSGAVAVIVTNKQHTADGHKLLGGAYRTAPEHHELCRWGMTRHDHGYESFLATDAVQVLQNGVRLGLETWQAFLDEMHWGPGDCDRVITHQVGQSHQAAIRKALEIDAAKDFVTYPYLGNMGTVSLPLTAAMASEQAHIQTGHNVAWLGIGSGLNCLMLGVEW
jgi:3-oxoacyl-[acyl-carrier-protein] synthase-3